MPFSRGPTATCRAVVRKTNKPYRSMSFQKIKIYFGKMENVLFCESMTASHRTGQGFKGITGSNLHAKCMNSVRPFGNNTTSMDFHCCSLSLFFSVHQTGNDIQRKIVMKKYQEMKNFKLSSQCFHAR